MNAKHSRRSDSFWAKVLAHFPILVAVLTACQSVGVPIGHGTLGTVYGENESEAKLLASMADRAFPLVIAMLGVADPRPVTIHIGGDLEDAYAGTAAGRRIRIDRKVLREDVSLFVMAHELVHTQCPRELEQLPPAVLEGVADFIAGTIDPKGGEIEAKVRIGSLVEAYRLGQLVDGSLEEAFELSDGDLYELTESPARYVPGDLGFLVVWRIGLTPLNALCAEARAHGRSRVPTAVLCEAARLDSTSPRSWIAALVETVPLSNQRAEQTASSPSLHPRP